MCARLFYLILAAVVVFVMATTAAFVYLPWWAAVPASAAALVAVLLACQVVVRRMLRKTVRRVGEAAKGLFDGRSRVLRNAAVDVHSVRTASAPPGRSRDLRWYEIDATVFPDPDAAAETEWLLDDLRLVPADAPPPEFLQGVAAGRSPDGYPLLDVVLVENGREVTPVDGVVDGVRRLRFVAGAPRDVRELAFRYHFEQFGRVRLSPGPALPGPR